VLPSVTVDTYNEELRDREGFLGDRASGSAFRALLENWRESLSRNGGEDPFGDTPSDEISKKKLDRMLKDGDPEAAGVIHGAIEDFAKEMAGVLRRFLRLKDWKDTERIAVGGGLRASRIGELAIGRASVILKSEGIDVTLVPIANHPDEAGLIGAVHLAPSWMFSGHDSILAVDIGGSNIRVGTVALNLKKDPDFSGCEVVETELWRHADEQTDREGAVARLVEMLGKQIDLAEKAKLKLAPFVGIACPGIILEDGSIDRGGQNLPGNWESKRFNLPTLLQEALPQIDGHTPAVVIHNDAVVQGLSEIPRMRDVERWGVLTIGTGLGNARFTNRKNGGKDGKICER
jgi:predicted NBD/HSP70 family sugar kinase